MSNEKVLRVSADSDRAVRKYAEERGLTVSEAANKLLATAIGRRAALARYAKTHERATQAGKRVTKKRAKGRAARG